MGKMKIRVLVVLGGLLAGCGSSPTDGGGPFAPGGSTAAALVGKWKLTRSTGEPKNFYVFSNDGRFTVYKANDVEVEVRGTYTADANKIAVDATDGSNRIQGSATYAVSGDELAIGLDDDSPVFVQINSLPNGSRFFRSEMAMTEFRGGVATESGSITADLEVRPNGTWKTVATMSSSQNGVARPVENNVVEGIEWREISPGRYLTRKSASNAPVYLRLLGGRAVAMERYVMTRVR